MTAAASRSSAIHLVSRDSDPFLDAVQAGIRQMRRSTHMTPHQRRLLDDLNRGRYLSGLRQYCEMGREQAVNAADACALFDMLKGFVIAGHTTQYTTPEAFGLETQANQELDDAQWRHAFTPSTGTIDRMVEKASAQEVASSILRHAVIRQRPALVSLSGRR